MTTCTFKHILHICIITQLSKWGQILFDPFPTPNHASQGCMMGCKRLRGGSAQGIMAALMLKLLRNKANQKKIFVPLTVAVITSFGVWGVMVSKDEGDTAGALGKIGNKTVTIQDYLKSYKAVQHQLELFYGEKARGLGNALNLKGQAWDRILLLEHAKKQKIRVSDEKVVSWIAGRFAVNGRFDEALYKRYVDLALRSNPRDFEEEVRGNLTIAEISENMMSKISLTEDELKKTPEEQQKIRDQKFEESMQPLLTELRNGLKLNLEVMNKLFPPEPETTPEDSTTQ